MSPFGTKIEPDRQISRIRLSDKTSRLRFRVQRHLQLLNMVMAVLSPHVYCRGQSGKNLLAMSISHFDPNETSDLVFKAMADGLHHSSIN
jgi:hypothetical protein